MPVLVQNRFELGILNKWLLTLLITSVCISCSIEKRHHTGGYYIKWHKRYNGSGNNTKVEKEADTSTVELIGDSVPELPDEEVVQDPETDSVVVSSDKKERPKLDALPREERKFEPLGVLAFKILLGNILVGIAADNTSDKHTYTQLEIVFLAILLIAFILGIISMVRYLRNPRHYKFNIFAIVAILVPLFYLIEFLLGNLAL